MLLDINHTAKEQVEELAKEGWEVFMHYADHSSDLDCPLKGVTWEVDFTRKKEDGLFDNHLSGFHYDLSTAIHLAYINIKNGAKLVVGKRNVQHPLEPGTRVRIINYGSKLWEFKEDGSINVLDMCPEIVGREGTIEKYNTSTIPNSPFIYAINLDKGGKHAWYHMDQIEIINPNT